ncbi:ArnT family glycosyltransferase [Urechidicola croceus]|uniref:Glycosyltransferase RgtA/B/C/D-like domain-containing protein n=1 Tax=Urechidicola croceus TaxID=1850246 RepID=A0A1D8P8N7_9FLAO|nr:glycosyltransferase family 39 protein [Urechidicola croceus]AOW20948.1 hypothetical protein LPB138_09800 [Urechidicola croceus]
MLLQKPQQILILILLSSLLFTAGISKIDIYSLDEVKNVEAAREMIVNNDLIVPKFNGNLRTDKPPLHYYFMILSFKLFGVSPFSARLFSSLMGLFTILIVYFFTAKNINEKIGFFSGILLLSSLHFNIQMHMAVPDPYLIFILTFAGFSFYEFYENKNKLHWWLFYILIGFGILAKGPIAIVLSGFSIFLYLIMKNEFTIKTINRINPLGIFISIGIAFPWFYLVHKATNGEYTEAFFFKHNMGRFSKTMEGHGGIFLLTLVFVILGLIPFFFFLFDVKKIKKLINKNTFYLYSLCFALAVIIFFMISSTKLPNYTVPAYPWLFILLTGLVFKVSKKKRKKYLIAILIFSLLLPIGITVGLNNDKTISHLYYLGFIFFILTIGAVTALVYRTTYIKWLHVIIASWILIALLFFHIIYPKIDSYNPISMTKDVFNDKETVVGYQKFNPAFVFEFKREIPVLKTIEELELFIKNHPEGGKVITRVKKENMTDFQRIGLKEVIQAKDIFENPTTLILEF